jgi:hypothetical protein
MLNKEDLFERAKTYQEESLLNPDFWQSLYAVLDEIVYYGGADIEYNGRVYMVRTDFDAIKLLLGIYRDEICKKEESSEAKSL